MSKRQEWRSAADAIDSIRSGMTVGVGHLGAEPTDLTAELWSRGDRLRDVTLLSGMMLTGYPFLNAPDAFRLKTWFMPGSLLGPEMRDIRLDYLPLDWTQTACFLAGTRIDVALVQVSEADAEGYHSLGISTSQQAPMISNAAIVIAEVNPAMPRTRGRAALIHRSRIDICVRAEHLLIEFPHRKEDAIDRQVGLNAASLIPDGSILQFGIGTIPAAMLDRLVELGRKDLLVYSQLSDAARRLVEAGACRGAGPQAVIGEILGTRSLYSWADNNNALMMASALETHSLEALSGRSNFVSVNSAMEIDLFGQVNSEILNGCQIGAIGGSLDFAMGGQFQGGRAIIALRSATKSGRSRIVPCLPQGPVTLPRSLVQTVVTEYGIADLRGKSVAERALAIAAIAHPDHRETLTNVAARLR